MKKNVFVTPYDEEWPGLYGLEKERLASVLGAAAAHIHHVGSTSVRGLCAKPVIDILVESPDLEMIEDVTSELEGLGYEAKGEYGIPDRRYFSRPPGSGLAVHVHCFRFDHEQIGRLLRFRDYLRAHPPEASRYCRLKQSLAIEHPDDRDAYQDGKADYIRQAYIRDAEWHDGALERG